MSTKAPPQVFVERTDGGAVFYVPEEFVYEPGGEEQANLPPGLMRTMVAPGGESLGRVMPVKVSQKQIPRMIETLQKRGFDMDAGFGDMGSMRKQGWKLQKDQEEESMLGKAADFFFGTLKPENAQAGPMAAAVSAGRSLLG